MVVGSHGTIIPPVLIIGPDIGWPVIGCGITTCGGIVAGATVCPTAGTPVVTTGAASWLLSIGCG